MKKALPIIFIIALLLNPCWAAYPKRIISGLPSITETLFALGLNKRIVGVTTNCNYPQAALRKEKIGGFFLNLEKVVALKPDMVIMLEDAQKNDINKFKAYGLNVFTVNPHDVEGVLESIIAVGKATGREGWARALVGTMRWRINNARPKSKGIGFALRMPRVIVIVGSNPLIVAGGGTFIDNIILLSGGENIARETKGAYPQFSLEKLLKDDPECIIIPKGVLSRNEIEKDGRWRKLRAVKTDRILFIDPEIISRPGPRIVDAIEIIARFIYGSKAY